MSKPSVVAERYKYIYWLDNFELEIITQIKSLSLLSREELYNIWQERLHDDINTQQVAGDKSYHGRLVFPAGAAEVPGHQTGVRAGPQQLLDVHPHSLPGPRAVRLLQHWLTKRLVLASVVRSGHCELGVLLSTTNTALTTLA